MSWVTTTSAPTLASARAVRARGLRSLRSTTELDSRSDGAIHQPAVPSPGSSCSRWVRMDGWGIAGPNPLRGYSSALGHSTGSLGVSVGLGRSHSYKRCGARRAFAHPQLTRSQPRSRPTATPSSAPPMARPRHPRLDDAIGSSASTPSGVRTPGPWPANSAPSRPRSATPCAGTR